MRAHFTPRAEIDLEEVGDYIALDNPRRAVSFIREIRQHCEKIAGGPDHYVARSDLGDTIRICAHGNYLIVFEPFDDGALILRVLHGARNVQLNDPLIAIRVAWLPKHLDPFGINRLLSPPSNIF